MNPEFGDRLNNWITGTHIPAFARNLRHQRPRKPESVLTMTQIRFCRSFDDVRIAYACAGRGPKMVEVAT
jgi:hypothetical protein